MKKIVPLLFVSSLLLLACNNDKPKDSITITDIEGKEKGSIDMSQVADDMQDMQKKKEELEKLTPLTTDELKALVPAALMGATAMGVDVNSAMGATVANADYKINDSVDLRLEIVDCGGAGGAGMFAAQYMNMFNVNSDDEEEYVKTIEFNGGKAFENCKKKKNRCTLAYFSGDRFLVSLRGDNVGIEAIKDLAKGLKIQ
ncbi:MAG: hypothetical protein SGI83_09865 [Bacteroidota bacterium]|nr:hypothetical protein [Bacteroidota bacterium]